MEKIYDLKLARAIGVSNANAEQLERVQKNARVPIHDNQVECHLHLNQKDLKVNNTSIGLILPQILCGKTNN
jgi:diketogulonate reductase-like aldo/keto reductase